MKTLTLTIAMLAIVAATAFASSGGTADDVISGKNRPGHHDEVPTAPVPEPGTMALTSMGLVAIGAAIRKRRSK